MTHTAPPADEILTTFTTYQDRFCSLDDLQGRIEGLLGMHLERTDLNEDATSGSCRLMAKSPTGVPLFKIQVGRYPECGWRFAGQGNLLDGSWESLIHLHEAPVENSVLRRDGQVLTVRRFEDGTVEEKVA
jgi:hypothetical protein